MEFVYNEPAVISDDKLIIGDLHIGLESELRKRGINTPTQSKEMSNRITKILFENNCSELVILGDLKHGIPWAEWDEKKNLKKFIKSIESKASVKIVKGNHDASIEKYIEKDIIKPQGYRDGEEYFLHGHAEPKDEAFECKQIFMSHLHPTIKITDSLGKTTVQKTWLKGKVEKNQEKTNLLIVPSFNKLISGRDIREEFMGPMKKYINTYNLEVTLLDGTNLGKLKDIEKNQKTN